MVIGAMPCRRNQRHRKLRWVSNAPVTQAIIGAEMGAGGADHSAEDELNAPAMSQGSPAEARRQHDRACEDHRQRAQAVGPRAQIQLVSAMARKPMVMRWTRR